MARALALVLLAAVLAGASAQKCKDINTVSFTFRKDLAAGQTCKQDLSGADKQEYDNCVEGSNCQPTGTDPNVRECSALNAKAGAACTASGNECQGATDGATQCVNDVCRKSGRAGDACSVNDDCTGCGTTQAGANMCTCQGGMCKGTLASGDTCESHYQCPVGTFCRQSEANGALTCQAPAAKDAFCPSNGQNPCALGLLCAATDFAADANAFTCQEPRTKANDVKVSNFGPGTNDLCASGYVDTNGKCADPNTVRTGDMYVADGAECQGAAAGDNNKMCKNLNSWCVCEGNGVGKCKAAPAGWNDDKKKREDDLAKCMFDNCPPYSSDQADDGNCAEKHCKDLARYSGCAGTAQALASLNGGTPDWAVAEEAAGGACSSAAGVAAGAVTAVIALAAAAIVA